MEPDDVVIQLLRDKLQKARGSRADAIMAPKEEAVAVEGGEELSPEDMEALMQMLSAPEEEVEEDEVPVV